MNRSGKASPEKKSIGPVVRLRTIVIWGVLIGLFVACPLFSVWKQVCVRDLSIRKTALADSLVACNREIARLRLIAEKYSATPRIENVARERLGLEYPTADRIVVIRPVHEEPRRSTLGGWEFLAILRRSLSPDRGS
jgi:cell division protein FtsL